MKKSLYYAFTLFLFMFISNTFIFRWLGLSDDPIDFETIAGKLIIWLIAGTSIFFLKEYERRKQLKAHNKKQSTHETMD